MRSLIFVRRLNQASDRSGSCSQTNCYKTVLYKAAIAGLNEVTQYLKELQLLKSF